MDEKKDYCYELWGNDTFSNEIYQCGVYRHYSSARRAMKRHVADTLDTQSDGLRDTFWITKTTVEEHNAAINAKWARVDAAHKRVEQEKEIVETFLPDLESFIKKCTQSVGIYEFPLPDIFKETCITSIKVIYEKAYRCRVKYSFKVAIAIENHQGYLESITVCYAYGRLEEIVAEITGNEYMGHLREFIDRMILKHYCDDL